MTALFFARLNPDATLPVRKHPHDAGVDVFSIENCVIFPFSSRIVGTGLTFEISEGFMLEARPKGRHNHLIGAGIIDTGYQGEILIKIVNYEFKFLRIKKGDPIAQLILVNIETPTLVEMDKNLIHLKESDRGGSGGIVNQNNKRVR